jgi:hypothetical protein
LWNYIGDFGSPYRGFTYSNGNFTPIDYPGSYLDVTLPSGVNDLGEIVGNYALGPYQGTNGFVYNGSSYPIRVNIDFTGIDTSGHFDLCWRNK